MRLVWVKCPTCNGTGKRVHKKYRSATNEKTCFRCGGKGKIQL